MTRRPRGSLAAVVALATTVLASGCFTVHYVDSSKQPTGATYTRSASWFGYGMGGSADLTVDTSRCGAGGVARMQSTTGVFGAIIGIVTLNMWKHRTFEITCAGGQG